MKFIIEYWNNRCERVPEGTEGSHKMESTYTDDGLYYIGNWEDGKYLQLRGIEPINNHLGWCEVEKKWYGWSHRTIFGFGIGSTVKLGDCAYQPSNRAEFIRSLDEWYSDPTHKHLKLEPFLNGVKISYDVVVDYSEIQESMSEEDKQELIEVLKEQFPEWEVFEIKSDHKGHQESIEPYPRKWGRGEWTANTLEDAKQMAEDFAEGVS